MKRRYNFFYPVIIAAVLALGMIIGTRFRGENSDDENVKLAPNKKLNLVLSYIRSSYVDKVDMEELLNSSVNGALQNLDPHSVYISRKEYKSVKQPLKGNFEGIGIEFNIMNDTIVVVSPISGGPSDKLGIQAGDKIVRIEGEEVAGVGITNQKVIQKLRGKKGTEVSITVKRINLKKPLHFTIVRDKIPLHSIDASYMIDDKTGYVKINRFSAKTLEEYQNAFDKLKEQGVQGLILDLRGNPGGYLKAAIKLADEFLTAGKVIVYTKGRSRPRQVFEATPRGGFEKGNLLILINEGSASASEIVSGAIQDHDRGMIIGRRSFGKGLVQEEKVLPDGSALRLTVARYYTPTGRCIQKPYDQGVEEYRKELLRRDKHGELVHKDSIELPDSLKYKTPEGRTVYGGGGIMPDIFVPLDTNRINPYLEKILRKGLINRFAINFVSQYKGEILENYPNLDIFISRFKVKGVVLDKFIHFARVKGLEYKSRQMQNSLEGVVTRIKALIARQLWDDDAYFRVINRINPAYQRALKYFRDQAS